MNTITVTELRRNPAKLLESLDKGMSVTILYRSRVLGVAEPLPKQKKILSKNDLSDLEKILNKIKPKKLLPKNKRDEIYQKRLEEKYGPRISRHKYPDRYLRA